MTDTTLTALTVTPAPAPVAAPIVNATIRAVVTLSVLAFAIGMIVFCVVGGNAANSLHQSAMSWSYMLVIFTMVALGIDSAAVSFITTMRATK
jgi:hypothetical protein